MARETAYRLRARAGAQGFAAAWDVALARPRSEAGRARLEAALAACMSCYEPGPVHDASGAVVGIVHPSDLPAALQGEVGQALRVEFDHQTGPMQLDRARRDAEFICDKAIWIASRNSSQNGPFALRQSRGFRKSVGLFGGTTGYTLKPAEAAVDRAEQCGLLDRFGEKVGSARLHRLYGERRIAIARQHHDGHVDTASRQLRLNLQAVHVGHANVHQHHVRAQPPGALHRFAAAGGFRADFHVGHLHQTFQAHSGQGLVVADQDLHFRDVVHGFPFFLFTRFFYWSG